MVFSGYQLNPFYRDHLEDDIVLPNLGHKLMVQCALEPLPDKEAIELASERRIVLLGTNLPMFEACGRLYGRGLPGGSEIQEGLTDVKRASFLSTL